MAQLRPSLRGTIKRPQGTIKAFLFEIGSRTDPGASVTAILSYYVDLTLVGGGGGIDWVLN